MLKCEVGIGRVNTDETGWVDCFFYVDGQGFLPFFIYSSFGGMDCWQTRPSGRDPFAAARQFCQRKGIDLSTDLRYIYQASSGGWALWKSDVDAPEGWKLVASHDRIAAQGRLRGA